MQIPVFSHYSIFWCVNLVIEKLFLLIVQSKMIVLLNEVFKCQSLFFSCWSIEYTWISCMSLYILKSNFILKNSQTQKCLSRNTPVSCPFERWRFFCTLTKQHRETWMAQMNKMRSTSEFQKNRLVLYRCSLINIS